jgi:hypothetical protein
MKNLTRTMRGLAMLLAGTCLSCACSDFDWNLNDWVAQPSAAQSGAANGMSTWRHPLGAAMEVPADWETIPTDGSSAFVPPDGRSPDGSLRVVGSFVFLPANAIERIDQLELISAADLEIASFAANARRIGDPELLVLQDRVGIALKYHTEDGEFTGRVDVLATLHDGMAVGLLVAGERELVELHAAQMRAMMASLRFETAERDQALAGRWTRSESYSSGSFSMATETTLKLYDNGRFERSSQAVGGDMDNSFDSGSDGVRGSWIAKNGELTLQGDEGSTFVYQYKFVDGTLVLYDSSGKRTLWN